MKHIFSLLLLSLCTLFSACQKVRPAPQATTAFTTQENQFLSWRTGSPSTEVFYDEQGQPLGVSGPIAPVDNTSRTTSDAAVKFLRTFGVQAWGWSRLEENFTVLRPEYEPVPVAKGTGEDRVTIETVQFIQMYYGLAIENRQASVLVATHGREPGFHIGGYFGHLGSRPPLGSRTTTPAFTVDAAFARIQQHPDVVRLYGGLRNPNGASLPHKGVLLWHEFGHEDLRLCYRILARGAPEEPLRVSLLIDAMTGDLYEHNNEVFEDVHDSFSTTAGQAHAWLPPMPRTINVLQDGSEYHMASHFTSSHRNVVALWNYFNRPTFFSAPQRITAAGPNFLSDEFFSLRYATDVFTNIQEVLNYYRSNYGWLGWNGRGNSDLDVGIDFVHPHNGDSFNAYSFGSHLQFPRGTTPALIAPSGVALDVVAHEFMHSFLEAANPLNRGGEPDALNEALADLSGQTLKRWADNVIGAACSADGSIGVRNVATPSIDRYELYDARADIHSNGGIVNKAHSLMVRGGAHRGFDVRAFDSNLDRSGDMASHLVLSALLARTFPRNTSLRDYGVGLFSWCRTQEALFSRYGSSATARCGTVRDALVATQLIPLSPYPVDLELRSGGIRVAGTGTPDAYVQFDFSVRNNGSARYTGPLRISLRNLSGDRIFGTYETNNHVQPGAAYSGYGVEVSPRYLLSEMPRFEGTFSLVAGPEDSTMFNNYTHSAVLFGLPLVVGRASDLLIFDGATAIPQLALSLARYGDFPFQNQDVAARFLYRAGTGRPYNYLATGSNVQQHFSPSTLLPADDAATRGTVNLKERVNDTFTVPPAQLVHGPLVRVGSQNYGQVFMNATGALQDENGTYIVGPVLLAVLNTNNVMRTNEDSKWVYCLNCRGTDDSGRAITEFSVVRMLEGINPGVWPTDLNTLAQRLTPPPLRKQEPPFRFFMLPSWPIWFEAIGPDPAPEARLTDVFNVGP